MKFTSKSFINECYQKSTIETFLLILFNHFLRKQMKHHKNKSQSMSENKGKSITKSKNELMKFFYLSILIEFSCHQIMMIHKLQ